MFVSRRSTDGGNTFSAPVVIATVNIIPYTTAILNNPPHATSDFYPFYAPMARLFMTMTNRPLFVCGSYQTTISYLGGEEQIYLYSLFYSLGTVER